jgi:DNA-binding CsgD family transcriptional regulator
MYKNIHACWIEQAQVRPRENAENGIGAGTAVLVIDQQGRTLFGNSKAIAQVPGGCNRLKSEADRVRQKVRPLIADALRSTDSEAVRCTTAAAAAEHDDPEPLAVVVCPIQPVGSDGAGHTAALVIAARREKLPRPQPADLAQAYGLTRAEAKLLAALIAGETLGDYCKRAGIRPNTGKTHLRQVFAKTQTNRQTDAVREVLTNPVIHLKYLFSR